MPESYSCFHGLITDPIVGHRQKRGEFCQNLGPGDFEKLGCALANLRVAVTLV